MPGLDLSSLNRQEVRRLLAAAEARQNHALAERLRTELAGRGGQGRALPVQPMQVVTGSFNDVWGLEGADAEGDPKRARRGRIAAAILGAGAAAAVAIGVGWQLGRSSAPVPPPPVAAVVAPAPVPLPLPPPAPAAPVMAQVAPEPPAERAEVKPVKPKAKPVPARALRAAQDRRMLRAYNQARAAGVDLLMLDAGQARFRAALARTRGTGPVEQLYAKRIRELNAATAKRRATR